MQKGFGFQILIRLSVDWYTTDISPLVCSLPTSVISGCREYHRNSFCHSSVLTPYIFPTIESACTVDQTDIP